MEHRFLLRKMGRCMCCAAQSLRTGIWTAEEDSILKAYIQEHGDRGNWRKLPSRAGLPRCGKSCRLRWLNYLRPDLKRGSFSDDEADLILKLHSLLGNRWALIAGRIPGRTDNEIKNFWNFHLSKKLLKMGINPKTHKPLDEKSQWSSCTSTQASSFQDDKKSTVQSIDASFTETTHCKDTVNGELSDTCTEEISWFSEESVSMEDFNNALQEVDKGMIEFISSL